MNIPAVDSILLVRIAITLTFFILAAGGPYALMKLRRFILFYTERHTALELRVQALERQIQEMRSHRDKEPGPP